MVVSDSRFQSTDESKNDHLRTLYVVLVTSTVDAT
jgi:hypothetical protein